MQIELKNKIFASSKRKSLVVTNPWRMLKNQKLKLINNGREMKLFIGKYATDY